METVEVIHGGANALSTFGLYAIVAALVVVIVHLYRRVNHLEEKLMEAVKESAEERGKELAKWQETTAQTQEVIKANTKALERFLAALENGRR
jgi:hypothetical protein